MAHNILSITSTRCGSHLTSQCPRLQSLFSSLIVLVTMPTLLSNPILWHSVPLHSLLDLIGTTLKIKDLSILTYSPEVYTNRGITSTWFNSAEINPTLHVYSILQNVTIHVHLFLLISPNIPNHYYINSVFRRMASTLSLIILYHKNHYLNESTWDMNRPHRKSDLKLLCKSHFRSPFGCSDENF